MSAVDTPYEWIWWGRDEKDVEHTSFGRWQAHPCQLRYKLAEVQPTEHDHPPASALEAYEAKVAALTAERDALREEIEHVETAARNLAAMLRQLRRWAPDEWSQKATNLLKRYGLQGSVFRAALRQEGKP